MNTLFLFAALTIGFTPSRNIPQFRVEIPIRVVEEIPAPPVRDPFYKLDRPFRRLPSKLFTPTIDEMWEYEIDKMRYPNKPVLEPIL